MIKWAARFIIATAILPVLESVTIHKPTNRKMNYQKLFDHMFQEHGLTLTEGQMQDIIHEVNSMQSHANKDGWVSVKERLPELIHTMGCGNKYSEDVLITNGEDSYVAYLEAVRPAFEKKIWTITVNDDMTVKDHTGKEVTHWKKITLPQI